MYGFLIDICVNFCIENLFLSSYPIRYSLSILGDLTAPSFLCSETFTADFSIVQGDAVGIIWIHRH